MQQAMCSELGVQLILQAQVIEVPISDSVFKPKIPMKMPTRFLGTPTLCKYSFWYWVLVKAFNISSHNQETILLTIDPYYGNLSKFP